MFLHKENIPHYIERCKIFRQRLQKQLWVDLQPLDVTFALYDDDCSFADRERLNYKSIKTGTEWANKPWLRGWFCLQGKVPDIPPGSEAAMKIDFAGQGLIYDKNGIALESLTQLSVFDPDFKREAHRIDEKPGQKVERWIDTCCMNLMGVSACVIPDPDWPRYGHCTSSLNKAHIGIFRRDIWHLMAEIYFLQDLYHALPEGSRRARLILNCINKAINTYEDDSKNCTKARGILQTVLKQPANKSALRLDTIGHAHLDTAWLWPVRVGEDKAVQTFANQVRNINENPTFCFGASQPQHYEFVRNRQPELFERVKKAVADNRWELQGGMWVESDCNMPGGESLIRQYLQGQRFYREHFGKTVTNSWLPDVFGYNGNLPQIMLHCGCTRFLTQKLCWNSMGGCTTFPFFTFRWKGVDGSEVLAHFPPANTYGGASKPQEIINAEYRYNEAHICESGISLIGIGDGGGGPADEHLKAVELMTDCEGAPRVNYRFATEAFDSLETHWDELPTWRGELYLETHRGTLTAQARVKKRNRRLERQLQYVEQLLTLASLDKRNKMRDLWRDLLRNQFHDILPGSSIHQVYLDSHQEYDAIEKQLDNFQEIAFSQIGKNEIDSFGLYNPAPCDVTKRISLPEGWQAAVGNEILACNDGNVLVQIPAHCSCTLHKTLPENIPEKSSETEPVLENEFVSYRIDTKNGCIINAFDKRLQRTFITDKNPGNLIELFIDQPNNFPAWDIDTFYENMLCDTAHLESFVMLGNAPTGSAIRLKFRIGKSSIEQTLFLDADSPRLDFETHINWLERDRVLRVRFPFELAPITHCRADIPYAYNERVMHRNLPGDSAQFEFSAQRYCDISEDAFGVALINDCKYGHSVLGNTLGITLLTGSQAPDPDADLGRHELIYSIFPHSGWQTGNPVWDEAEGCNTKFFAAVDTNLPELTAPVNLTAEGIRLCAWKQHEDDSEVILIRLVEIDGRNNSGSMTFDPAFTQITPCNGIEDPIGESLKISGSIELTFRPFEIRSYLLSKVK
jgi:alpha-mannosidase